MSSRLFESTVAVVKLVERLPNSTAGRNAGGQLFRSATSAAANYEEACAAESRADFVHKMQPVFKELKESRFRLRLIGETAILARDFTYPLVAESTEVANIIGKSLVQAKRMA